VQAAPVPFGETTPSRAATSSPVRGPLTASLRRHCGGTDAGVEWTLFSTYADALAAEAR